MWRWIIAATAILMVYTANAYAQSTPRCGPVDSMADMLDEEFGEKVWTWAVNSYGRLVQVWMGDTGTWTLTEASPVTGMMCIVATGRDGWDLPPPGDPV